MGKKCYPGHNKCIFPNYSNLNPVREINETVLRNPEGHIHIILYKMLVYDKISLLRSSWVCDYNTEHKTFQELSNCCML